MGINRKCLKLMDESKTIELEDRITSLPDNLITHILSLLPTKYAVRTSALSTFWKEQWTSIPNLDFDDQLLSYTQKFLSVKRNQMSFMNFVYRVLVLHKAPLTHRFHLHYGHPYDASHLNTWVSAAISRNVQELDLFIPGDWQSFIPCQLFTHSTLVKLKMGSNFVLNIPSSVYLQRLKVMHLFSVSFEDVESFYRLFSGCPVLEDLIIHSCTWKSISVLNITSPTLKSLTIHIPDTEDQTDYKIELNTPSLLHFTYFDSEESLRDYSFKNMHFLVEARLHVESCDSLGNRISAIIEGISKVQSLYLSGEFLEAVQFAEVPVPLPTFPNLTSLAVGYNDYDAWELLPELLTNSPKLKYLVLNDGLFGNNMGRDDEYKWYRPKSMPACLSHHLEVMKVLAFKGNSEELRMIKYILRKAKVLRKLIIESAMNAQDELKVSKELFTFPRGSKSCKVMIS